MVRVKRGNVAHKRRTKVLTIAKGYCGAHSRLFRIANQQVMKALKYSYIARKKKRKIFRKIWICRINAAIRIKNINYNCFIKNLNKFNIRLNRKMLSQIVILDNSTFYEIYKLVNLTVIFSLFP